MESFQVKQLMPISPKEILNSPSVFQNSTNNNKYLNLMLMGENEQAVYLCTEDSLGND